MVPKKPLTEPEPETEELAVVIEPLPPHLEISNLISECTHTLNNETSEKYKERKLMMLKSMLTTMIK